jgi:succinoglycan biosynthesis transport protein ExoP
MHFSNDHLHPQSAGPFASSERSPMGAADVLVTLRREWRFPLFGCLIGLTLAVSFIVLAKVLTPAVYKSTARVLIDRSMNENLQAQKIIDNSNMDLLVADSQAHIISSESIVVPVVRSMNLAHDTEFVGPPHTAGGRILWQLKNFIGLNDDAQIDPNTFLERTAVETFLTRLTAYREDQSYVIDVSFVSEDPNKAARIANAVVDRYLVSSLEAKSQSTKVASQWLQDRLAELKLQATDADRTLQNYKIDNNIVDTGHQALFDHEQLSNLNTQLISARTATAEAKARLDRIQQVMDYGIPSVTVTDALNNSVITKIRTDYFELAARLADITSRVGPEHLAADKLRKQMDELRKLVRDEEDRIAHAYASDYEIAKSRENYFMAAMAQLVGVAQSSGQAQVSMRDLESSADTYRNLYNSFLQKFEETIQRQTIPVTDSRIISMAAPPLHADEKKIWRELAGGMVFGLFTGAAAALAREWIADVFRTPKAVEEATGMHCVGILPKVSVSQKRLPRFRGSAKSAAASPNTAEPIIDEFVLDAPYSRFTETLRNVEVLINSAQRVKEVKVVGVVSSAAKEGKTTVATNLAALLIASGARTLIIDGDFHQRSLSARLAPDAREGMIEALGDPSRLDTLIYHRERSGLDVLPCILKTDVPHRAQLLGSPQMEELIIAARKTYDYIIIELPPIVSVVDVKVIERFIDKFVFVVEWGRSKRNLVLEALSDAQMIRERLIGIVLNNADPLALRSIEAYKRNAYASYHQE